MMEQNNTSKAETHAANSRPEIEQLLPLQDGGYGADGNMSRDEAITAIQSLIAQEADKLANKRVREVLERVMVGGLEETPERSLHNVMANIQAELDKGDSHGRSKS